MKHLKSSTIGALRGTMRLGTPTCNTNTASRMISMRLAINNRSLELALGDITLQAVDAIVNAANSQLAGGGGVDGAIHRRGGPEIMAEIVRRYPDGCVTGSAVITGAGRLSAKYVIHAVGPIWGGGQRNEADLLAAAYRRSFELADQHNCRSIALPALSTGAYRFPMDQASRIAIQTTADYLNGEPTVELARFVLFGEGAFGAFAAASEQLLAKE